MLIAYNQGMMVSTWENTYNAYRSYALFGIHYKQGNLVYKHGEKTCKYHSFRTMENHREILTEC